MKYRSRALDKLKYNVVNSTALIAESTPLYSVFEVSFARMSDAMSLNARLIAAGTTYAGVGYLFGKGRQLSRKLFKITDQTKEKIQNIHDVAYTAVFNLVGAPIIYATSQALAGEHIDLTKIAAGTAAATVLGAVNGSPAGYAVDVFEDLSGIRECNRKLYPKFIKRQSARVKKGILVAMVGASIAITGLIYSLTPNEEQTTHEETTIEQRAYESDFGQTEEIENMTQELYSDRFIP